MSGSVTLAQALSMQPQPQAVSAADPYDFTDKYNTKLTPEEEAQYQAWGAANPTTNGRNPANDTYDYDMRGFWKASQGNPTFADNGHAGDAFKKPNHPTFSDQSQYNGVDGYQGGHWNPQPDGKYTFDPAKTNLDIHGLEGPEGLKAYFASPAEAGISTLNIPQSIGSNQDVRPLFSDAPVMQQAPAMPAQPVGSQLAAALSRPTGMPNYGTPQSAQIPLSSMMAQRIMQQSQGPDVTSATPNLVWNPNNAVGTDTLGGVTANHNNAGDNWAASLFQQQPPQVQGSFPGPLGSLQQPPALGMMGQIYGGS